MKPTKPIERIDTHVATARNAFALVVYNTIRDLLDDHGICGIKDSYIDDTIEDAWYTFLRQVVTK